MAAKPAPTRGTTRWAREQRLCEAGHRTAVMPRALPGSRLTPTPCLQQQLDPQAYTPPTCARPLCWRGGASVAVGECLVLSQSRCLGGEHHTGVLRQGLKGHSRYTGTTGEEGGGGGEAGQVRWLTGRRPCTWGGQGLPKVTLVSPLQEYLGHNSAAGSSSGHGPHHNQAEKTRPTAH